MLFQQLIQESRRKFWKCQWFFTVNHKISFFSRKTVKQYFTVKYIRRSIFRNPPEN